MAVYRQILVRFWGDEWVEQIEPLEKLLFIYLFSNDRSCLAGIYDISTRRMAIDTGLEREYVEQALERFAQAGKAFYEDGYIWVVNLPVHGTVNLRSPKVQANIQNTIRDLPNIPLKARWVAHWNQHIAPRYGIDTISQAQIPYLQNRSDQSRSDIPKGAGAPASDDAPRIPVNWQEWEKTLETVTNHPALVRRMCEVLYPGKEAPTFSFAGKVAKQMGRGIDGYRRLMSLLWEYSSRAPQGDLLPYLLRVHQGKERDNGTSTSERKTIDRVVVTGVEE